MICLITGGSASGKSAYAENLALETDCKNRIYIATMQPYGEEGKRRVEKHRAMRSGKGFRTVECFDHLLDFNISGGGLSAGTKTDKSAAPSDTVILLECISNLVANEQFSAGGSDEEITGRIMDGIRHLERQADHLIIVTNEVFSDGIAYDADTVRYIRILGEVNQQLAGLADTVTEVVCGIPVYVK